MLAESLGRMEVEKIVERKLDAVGHLRGAHTCGSRHQLLRHAAAELSIRLRIWGSDVRIVPGARDNILTYNKFSDRAETTPD